MDYVHPLNLNLLVYLLVHPLNLNLLVHPSLDCPLSTVHPLTVHLGVRRKFSAGALLCRSGQTRIEKQFVRIFSTPATLEQPVLTVLQLFTAFQWSFSVEQYSFSALFSGAVQLFSASWNIFSATVSAMVASGLGDSRNTAEVWLLTVK